jgi:hypothetical protein
MFLLDLCFSNSNQCVFVHVSQQRIETLMKNMAHVGEQEVQYSLILLHILTLHQILLS